MKRAFAFLFALIFVCLSGCKVKNYTPEIPASFEQSVTVSDGDFSYECEACRKDGIVTITVLDTNAKGMVMSYNGKSLNLRYNQLSYDIDAKRFEKSNPAIVIYELFDYIENTQDMNVRKIDSGFKYEGRISSGSFILLQNEDNSFDTLSFKTNDIVYKFK
ncbi:MAG: hypothetical protein ACI4RR_08145 [Eubacterium sp.]